MKINRKRIDNSTAKISEERSISSFNSAHKSGPRGTSPVLSVDKKEKYKTSSPNFIMPGVIQD